MIKKEKIFSFLTIRIFRIFDKSNMLIPNRDISFPKQNLSKYSIRKTYSLFLNTFFNNNIVYRENHLLKSQEICEI